MKKALVRCNGLKMYYPLKGGVFSRVVNHVRAVDGVDLSIFQGETLGLVGESGCGKSSLGRVILNLETPSEGEVFFQDIRLSEASPRQQKKLRRQMQIVFQDPYSSLNPRKTVETIIGEPFLIHNLGSSRERAARVRRIMDQVGLPQNFINRYPHEFSGGQRQRVGIARALMLEPAFIVCDEPVSALDVSVQAQVLNLLADLQDEYDLTYLFVSHDLSVVEHFCDRVAVMYLGRLVELAPREPIYGDPLHPYTRALLSACPLPVPNRDRQRIILQGDVPSPINPPPGCHFSARCPQVMPVCREKTPELEEVGQGHLVRCFLYSQGRPEAGKGILDEYPDRAPRIKPVSV